jgi:hypothetical protein
MRAPRPLGRVRGVNKVKVGFFSFTEITDPAAHREYNEWHQLDHMPEQFPMRATAYGQRWVSTPACKASRLVDGELLAPAHYMTLYLFTDSVDETLQEFMDLGQQLRALGRFFDKRRACMSGPLQWLDAHAAPRVLIAPEALPYRPNRGVYVFVDAWLAVPGVAGCWSFATAPRLRNSGWSAGNRRITVTYLDDDPIAVAEKLAPLLEARWQDAPVTPVHAGPYETVVPYQWNWFD